jgi:phosphoribosyl-AMP cyclohydrolase
MLDFKKSDGLVPAIVQDEETGEILMLAYMNEEAWKKTLARLKVHQVGGAACHEGYPSCFYRKVEDGELKMISTQVFDPEEVYDS